MAIEVLTSLLVIITAFYAWVTFRIMKANERTVAAMHSQDRAERHEAHLARAETAAHWIAIGLNPSLEEAMKMAVRETIDFITSRFPEISRQEAYMIASVAVDYQVTHCRRHQGCPWPDSQSYLFEPLTGLWTGRAPRRGERAGH